MAEFNKVILVGNLGQAAELLFDKNNNPRVKLSLGVSRTSGSGDNKTKSTDWIPVVFFGKSAESVSNYLTRGKQILVEGSLRENVWEAEGQKRRSHEVVANRIELLGGGESTDAAPRQSTTRQTTSRRAPAKAEVDEFADVPF